MQELFDWTFKVFDNLPPEEEYTIAFSGGKDSWCLLGMYVWWSSVRNKRLKLKVIFSDTWLEAPKLYELISTAKSFCKFHSIEFISTYPKLESSFWVTLFGRGYAVPDHTNRWCTKHLKIVPINQVKGKVLTGSHTGESVNRDQRLSGCGSTECGIDLINDRVEPLAIWRNCNVWDTLMQLDGSYLPSDISTILLDFYQRTSKEELEDPKDSSMRMGCFMCPVVKFEKIVEQVKSDIIPNFSTDVRSLIEELRFAPRILSERLGTPGATLVDARIDTWRRLQSYIPQLKTMGWIKDEEVALINELLSNRSYPKSYRQEWIEQQEPFAKPWTEHASMPNEYTNPDELEWIMHDVRFQSSPSVTAVETQEVAPIMPDSLSSSMTFNLPAIEGTQGKQPYFISQIPYDVLFNISVFDESNISFEGQAQRPLEESRVKAITKYILANPTSYTFNALVVAIGSDVQFERMSPGSFLGTLKMPMNSVCRIVDGQHRWHGIKNAIAENPALANDTISVVFFMADLGRMRQMFSDLNINPKKPSKSLSIAYDSRDEQAIIVNALHYEVSIFRKFVDPHVTTVSVKSPKLFSLQHLYKATQLLLKDHNGTTQDRKAKALAFWNKVYDLIPEWQMADQKEITSLALKRDYICTQGVTLLMLGLLGEQNIHLIEKMDWLKTNPFWKGVLIDGSGKMIPTDTAAKNAAAKIIKEFGKL